MDVASGGSDDTVPCERDGRVVHVKLCRRLAAWYQRRMYARRNRRRPGQPYDVHFLISV